jgi:hypothetical protein
MPSNLSSPYKLVGSNAKNLSYKIPSVFGSPDSNPIRRFTSVTMSDRAAFDESPTHGMFGFSD